MQQPFNGLPARWEPAGPSRGLGLVVPGRAYSPSAPLLELSRIALLQHGLTVHQVWWDTRDLTADSDHDAFVRAEVEAAVAEAGEAPALVVGKSLGTRAASYAAEHAVASVWLTPVLTDPGLVAAIAANPAPQLLVGGAADELWDGAAVASLRAGGCAVLEVPDADHGMAVPGDVVRSAEIQLEVARATHEFLGSLHLG